MDPSAIPAAPASLPAWAQVVYSIATLVVMVVLVPFLRSRTAVAQAQAELHQVDTSRSLLNQREAIVDQLKAYLLDKAANIAERYFPEVAADIAAGKLKTADDIKKQLHAWGTELYDDAVAHFKSQGIDLVERFGPQFINDMIELAANSVSPFPGKDTAKALLEGGAQALLQDGIHLAQNATTAVPIQGPPTPLPAGTIEAKA